MKIKSTILAVLLFFARTATVPAQNYGWTTIAGLYGSAGSLDGTNHGALFHAPTGIAADGAGHVFVADAGNYTIRKLTASGTNWVSVTIAGLVGFIGFADGTNTSAIFNDDLRQMFIDGSGNLYVEEYNPAYPFGQPWLIRELRLIGTNCVVNTIYNNSNPGGWAVDFAGNFYTATNDTIIKLTRLVTNGLPSLTNFVVASLAGAAGQSGTVDGTNAGARFASPAVFAVNGSGVIYVSDTNGIRTVAPSGSNWVVTSLTVPAYGYMTMDSQGNIAGSYSTGPTIQFLAAGATNWSSIGGSNGVSGGTDGTNRAALFSNPAGVAISSSGNLFVADTAGETIRQGANPAVPTGALQVSLSPTGAVAAGALWQVAAGGWQTNNATTTNLQAGAHVLSFLPVLGWTTPTNQLITIGTNLTTNASGTYVQQFGSLQVLINPAGATNAGAEWQLDGGPLQSSGIVLSNISFGLHTVAFLPIPGWITPSNQSVTLLSSQTTNLTATYIELGGVQTTILPATAVSAGAQWQLDGGLPQNSGVTLSNVPPGVHTVSFSMLTNWIAPATQSVSVVSGAITNVVGDYIGLGSLQVVITPAGALSAGAQWQLDGGAWYASGLILSNLPADNHTIAFTNLAGWTTPTNQIVTLNMNQLTVVTGVYAQVVGSVQVVLSPAGALSEGAEWELDGGPAEPSGFTLANVNLGAHTVLFSSVTGWISPTNQPVIVGSNETTRITGVYQQPGGLQVTLSPAGAIVAGAAWQIDGGSWLSGGTTVSNLAPGTHSLAFKPATGWVAPANQSLAIPSGQITVTNEVYAGLSYAFSTIAGTPGKFGSANGTNNLALFDDPAGLVAAGSIYVADTGNSVIRQLAPSNGLWLSSTLAGLAGSPGHADGTNQQAGFDFPSGIAAAPDGSLFIADQANATVRRMTFASNVWTVTTIAGQAGIYGSIDGTNTDALFYYPAGIAVDGSSNIYVTDQINSTIRKIVPLGSNNWAATTIAGTAGVTGSEDGTNDTASFDWPTGIAVDTNGCLYVADTFNDTIRKITPVGSNYVVATICGTAGSNGAVDGTNNTALFDGPSGVAVDSSDNLYVADSFSSLIRKITPQGTNWLVNTIGGLAYQPGSSNGTNTFARFDSPGGVGVDANGLVYVADTDNQTLRLGTPLSLGPQPFAVTASKSGAGAAGFSWSALVGMTYQVQFETNLLLSHWLDLGAPVLATNLSMPFLDTAASNSQRFYRVILIQP